MVEQCLEEHTLNTLNQLETMVEPERFLLEGVSSHTHQDVSRMNLRTGNDDEILVRKVILALKLGVCLLAFGMPAVDAEHIIAELCAVMEMPKPDLDFSLRKLTARFIEGTHTVKCAR